MDGGHAWPARPSSSRPFRPRRRSGGSRRIARATSWRRANGRGAARASASFAQVNTEVGAALHEYVLDRARAYRPATRRRRVRRRGRARRSRWRATARASSPSRPIATPPPSARASLPAPAHARSRRESKTSSSRRLPADVVLLNPPRVGVHERVTAALAAATPAPRAVIYVSCDPATLARDVARMPRLSHRVAARLRHVSADGARRNGVRARARREPHEVLRAASTTRTHEVVARRRRRARRRRARRRRASSRSTAARCAWSRSATRSIASSCDRARRAALHVVARRLSVRGRGARRTHARDSRALRQDRGRRPVRRRSSRRCPDSSFASTCSPATRCRRGRDSS